MKKDFLKNLAAGLFILFLFIFFYRPLETEDIWWHLNVGRWILEHHAVPHVDIFPFALREDSWILTQWLGSVIFYLIQTLAGYPGLQWTRVLVFVAALGLFFIYARWKIPFTWLLLLMFVMAFGLETRCILRPFIFNLIFIQLFLIILFRYQRHGNRRELYWLPLLMILWGNLHIGSFIYGLGLIVLFLFLEIIRRVSLKSTVSTSSIKIKNLLLILGLSAGALWINPYGVEGMLFPIKTFLLPGFIDFYGIGHRTSEMRPPMEIFSIQGIWFFLLLIPAIWILSLQRKDNLTHLIIFLVALFAFLYASRGADFFVIAAAYIIVEGAQRLALDQRWRAWPKSAASDQFIYALVIFLAVSNTAHLINQKVFVKQQVIRKIFLQEEADNPREAVRFLKTQGISGHVFNSYEYGGYLGWFSYPQLKPFVDGRQANQCDSKIYLKILAEPERLWPSAEEQYQFDIVLFNANTAFYYKFMDYLITRPGWQLVFVEGPVVIFVKRGKFALSESVARYEESLKTTKIYLTEIHLPVVEEKGLWTAPIKDFFNPPVEYNDHWETGAILYTLGYKEAGIKMLSAESVQLYEGRKARHVLSLMIEDYRREMR